MRRSLVATLALAALAATPTLAQPPSQATLPKAREEVVCSHVRVQTGSVTIQADDVAVVHLLEEIARQSDLKVTVYGALDARVTIDVELAPMREALERLLRGQSFALRYREPTDATTADGSEGSSNQLWVFPKEGGQATVLTANSGDEAPLPAKTVPTTLEAIARLLDQVEESGELEGTLDALAAAALSAEEQSVRAKAVYALGELENPDALPVLEQALSDPQERVREAAIEALSNVGSTDAAWALATALDDPSPSLRQEAIYALAEADEHVARTLLERALADEQPSVREAAEEALEELAEVDEEDEEDDTGEPEE